MIPAKKLAYTALFAALCCIATYLIKVPMPYGYFNIGDVFVLLAGWMLGGVWGGLAAGIGSLLADLLSGYADYALVTFIVKFTMSMVAFYGYKLLKKLVQKPALDFIPRFVAALVAELIMAFGYFAYECLAYGIGGGVAALPANLLQGGCCLVLGVALIVVLSQIPLIKKQFPDLHEKDKKKE